MPEKYVKASECEKYFYEHLDDNNMIGAMNAIDEMPAADVAPVVRCKDCKHFDKNKGYRDTKFSFSFCDKFHHNIIIENDFCSYGERIDGGVKE